VCTGLTWIINFLVSLPTRIRLRIKYKKKSSLQKYNINKTELHVRESIRRTEKNRRQTVYQANKNKTSTDGLYEHDQE